jgi:hypothetical protein
MFVEYAPEYRAEMIRRAIAAQEHRIQTARDFPGTVRYGIAGCEKKIAAYRKELDRLNAPRFAEETRRLADYGWILEPTRRDE